MTDHPDLGLEAGLWLTISEIADKKGKSRQAISKRVARLVEDGKLETRDGANGTKLVNLAAYDDAVGEVGDPSKEQAAETAQEAAVDQPQEPNRFRDAATRAKEYDADIKFLERAKLLKQVVPIGDVDAAATKIAETMVRVIDRLPMESERVLGAADKDRLGGIRAVLKEIAREQRVALAKALTELGSTAVTPTIDTELASAMDETDVS